MDLKSIIRNVPDFPKPGIQFKDLTTLWADPEAFKWTTDVFCDRYRGMGINKIVAAESRGFIVAAPVAYLLNVGFIPVRKKGKLPYKQVEASYQLEYGIDTLTMHEDAVKKGERVLIMDDLLATGGTVGAMIELVRKLGGEPIEAAFIVELEFLEGKKNIDIPVFSILKYSEE